VFPIGDDNSGRQSAPVVTYALIALNLLFFFVELNGGDPFILDWAFIPRRFLANPDQFEKRYPKVPAGSAHLLRELAPPPRRGAAGIVTGSGPVSLSLRAMARQIAKERGITIGEAQLVAEKLRKNGGAR
jgi:hypothetical protein